MESRGSIVIKNSHLFIFLPKTAVTHPGVGHKEVFIGMCLGNLIIHEWQSEAKGVSYVGLCRQVAIK